MRLADLCQPRLATTLSCYPPFSKSLSVIAADQYEEVHALWDRLSQFAAHEIDAAACLLMESISTWIGADRAAWVGAVRLLDGREAEKDPLRGWRTRTIVFHPPPTEAELLKVRKILQKGQSPEPGMTSIAAVQKAGQFRIHRLHDGFVDLESFRQTQHYRDHYASFNVCDRLWVAAPVGDQAEIFYLFDRRTSDDKFTDQQAVLAGYAIRGLGWLHRQLLYSHGILIAQSPLTATERAVMLLLLTDKSERDIAIELNQSPHTTHDHVKEIYRKLGVNSRTALMAVWLSNR